MAEINDLNVTDASNTGTAANAGFPENMSPADVNNAARALEGMIARFYVDLGGRTASTGSANAYALAASQTITAYYDGLILAFTASFANTGGATLAVDGLAATSILKENNAALVANDIESGQVVLVVYDGTNFQMLSPTASPHASASETVEGIAELATQAETDAGTDDLRIVTPLKLATRAASETLAGVAELATQAETDTGTDDARIVTPLKLTNFPRVAASETVSGSAELATQAETDTGTDDLRIVTPLKLTGRALLQGTHLIWVPAAAMRPRVSNGCATITTVETTAGRPDMHVLDFDSAAAENAQFSITMPSSWNEGTITFRTHHTHAGGQTAGLDGVAWGFHGAAVGHDDLIDVAFGTAVTVTVDHATAEDEMISAESGAVTVGGTPAASDRVIFQIVRQVANAADDLNIDARLLGVEILLTLDAGSDT